jgi:UDP-N-acetylglucosamine 2-epimerase
VKISPIIDALEVRSAIIRSSGENEIRQFLVHIGQHYDKHMSELFFDQLGMKKEAAIPLCGMKKPPNGLSRCSFVMK